MPESKNKDTGKTFKQRKSFATRKAEVASIRSQYSNKVPVIVERFYKEQHLPILDKTKFLVPQELSMSQFATILRLMIFPSKRRVDLDSTLPQENGAVSHQKTNVTSSAKRNRMSLNSNQAFYLIINNKSISSMSMTLLEVYRDEKDEDGFLYMTYASQEMFGAD